MAGRMSARTVRASRELGEHLTNWRKLQQLTAEQVAERAGISRSTLSKLEHGDPGVSTGILIEVLRALGQVDSLLGAVDPLRSDVGRLRAGQVLPLRVRGGRS